MDLMHTENLCKFKVFSHRSRNRVRGTVLALVAFPIE